MCFTRFVMNTFLLLQYCAPRKAYQPGGNGNQLDVSAIVSECLASHQHATCLLLCLTYCAFHVLVQTNFRRYYFYFLPDQAQVLLDHFNVLDEL